MRHDLDRQTALEELGIVEVVHCRPLRVEDRPMQPDVLALVKWTIEIISPRSLSAVTGRAWG